MQNSWCRVRGWREARQMDSMVLTGSYVAEEGKERLNASWYISARLWGSSLKLSDLMTR